MKNNSLFSLFKTTQYKSSNKNQELNIGRVLYASLKAQLCNAYHAYYCKFYLLMFAALVVLILSYKRFVYSNIFR
jgi:hypothetical protein